MTDQDSLSELALSMVTTLPRWGSWAAYMREVDTPYGRIGYRQTSIMWILRKGSADGMVNHNTTTGIAAEVGVQNSVITRAAEHLEHLGLVTRTTSTEDRRRSFLTLTENGVRASEYIESIYVTSILDELSRLNQETLQQLQNSLEVLHEIISNLSAKPFES